MQEKLIYEYAVIRYVPRVERGEFLNVGVILFCKRKDYLQVKYQVDEARLRAFYPDLDLPELQTYLSTWNAIARGKPADNPIAQLDTAQRFRWLTAPRSTIIQSSDVHPGLCEDPDRVLEKLFKQYVQ